MRTPRPARAPAASWPDPAGDPAVDPATTRGRRPRRARRPRPAPSRGPRSAPDREASNGPLLDWSRETLQTRRERSQVTHRRIVKAAYEAFCEQGYAGSTMADVAERAGVAVQTVYFVFHTKAELLSRAVAYVVTGEESDSRPPEERPFYREAVRAPDLMTALRAFVSGVGDMERMMAPLVPALVGAEGSRERGRHRPVPRGVACRRVPRVPRCPADQGAAAPWPDARAGDPSAAVLRRRRSVSNARQHLRLDARRVDRMDRPDHRRPGVRSWGPVRRWLCPGRRRSRSTDPSRPTVDPLSPGARTAMISAGRRNLGVRHHVLED